MLPLIYSNKTNTPKNHVTANISKHSTENRTVIEGDSEVSLRFSRQQPPDIHAKCDQLQPQIEPVTASSPGFVIKFVTATIVSNLVPTGSKFRAS